MYSQQLNTESEGVKLRSAGRRHDDRNGRLPSGRHRPPSEERSAASNIPEKPPNAKDLHGVAQAASAPWAWPGRSSKATKTPAVEFSVRNSLLTDMFAVSDIKTLFHLGVVVFVITVLQTLVHDLQTRGMIDLSVSLFVHSFGGLHRAIAVWLMMMTGLMISYFAFTSWSRQRLRISAGALRLAWDWLGLTAVALVYAALLTVPPVCIRHYDLPFASALSLLLDALRLTMKTHAFVRSNCPRALRDGTCPDFSQFLYFFFAPTLIYRDSYPRTSQTRWREVVCHMSEVLGCTLCICVVADLYILPPFRNFGLEPVTLLDLAAKIVATALPVGLVILCFFFLLLHSWQNAWAEMLRFGDRTFYLDWWNQGSWAPWFRTWNVLVQDWLFNYVYKDVLLLGGSGSLAKFTVFFVSAVAHEYFMVFTLRFFYPVLYLAFGLLGLLLSTLVFNDSSTSKIFLLLCIFVCVSIIYGLYSAEFYARLNCAQLIDTVWDYFAPRSWNCVPLR